MPIIYRTFKQEDTKAMLEFYFRNLIPYLNLTDILVGAFIYTRKALLAYFALFIALFSLALRTFLSLQLLESILISLIVFLVYYSLVCPLVINHVLCIPYKKMAINWDLKDPYKFYALNNDNLFVLAIDTDSNQIVGMGALIG